MTVYVFVASSLGTTSRLLRLGDLVDVAGLDVGQELRVADRLGVVVVLTHVNSSAAVPSTSTIITMPFRKNLGFNEEASGVRTTPVRRRSAEYSAGTPDHPGTEVLVPIEDTDDRHRWMVALVRVKDSQRPSAWEGRRQDREVGSGGRI